MWGKRFPADPPTAEPDPIKNVASPRQRETPCKSLIQPYFDMKSVSTNVAGRPDCGKSAPRPCNCCIAAGLWIRLVVIGGLLLGLSSAVVSAQQAGSGTPHGSSSTLGDFVQRHMPEVDQGDGIHLTQHFAVVFGDIMPGEGITGGGAVSQAFANGGFAQLKAEYSTRRFSLVQLRYDSREWRRRLSVRTRARWENAPELALFQLGPDSSIGRVNYGERRVEVSARGLFRVTRAVRVEAGGAVERYGVTSGELLSGSEEALASVPEGPGLGARTWFQRLTIGVIGDWRTPPLQYPRAGTFVSATLDDYRDTQRRQLSSYRVAGLAEHLVPTFSGRGIVDVTGRVWLTGAARGNDVPFFLMPTLGGGQYLEGYRLNRFRDRDAALLRGEYRWRAHEFVDVAGVYEIGSVARATDAFRAGELKASVAGGVRLHTKHTLVLSLDLAHSHEGFEVDVLFSAPR